MTENQKKIYVIGATGRLGRKVYERLIADGLKPIAIVRKRAFLPSEIVCDYSKESLKRVLADADVVVNAAGSVKTYDKKELNEANVELVKTLVAAAPEYAKIIHASSISVYGKQLAKKPADEQTICNPDSDYATSKYQGELALAKHPGNIILRIGTVYDEGPDYQYIMKRLKDGKMFLIGSGNNCIPFVHIDDVTLVFSAAASAPADLTGMYNIVGDQISQKEVYAVASSVLGVEPPKKSVPFWLVNTKAWLDEFFAPMTGKKPKITREHVAVLYYDRPFDCSKAKKELEFSPRKNSEGIKQVADRINSQTKK